MTMRKCVISVSGGLGDMISLLPLFSKFQGFFVISDLYKELFSLYEFDILWWEETRSEADNLFRLTFQIRKRNPEFTYGTYPNGRRINLLLLLSPGIKIFCDDGNFPAKRFVTLLKFFPGTRAVYIPFGIKQSYVSINSKILGVVPDYPFELKEKDEFREEAEKFSISPYAVIHPTAKYITKRWPLQNFINIGKKILDFGIKLVFVLGRGEENELKIILREFESYINSKDVLILYGESLLKVISYVKRAFFVLGNDSAVAHIAGISGVKTFVIYGYTRYYHTAPYGAEVIRLDLPCSPCYNFAKGEMVVQKECKYDIACLRNLPESMVFERIKNFICSARF